MSELSRPPREVKNLSPFRFQGRWLAVIITAAVKGRRGSTVDMNMAGVVARPRSVTSAPARQNAPHRVSRMAGPESRESRPTLMRSPSPSGNLARSQRTKPPAMASTASVPRFTSSPGTPGRATPRISLPFCSFERSISTPPGSIYIFVIVLFGGRSGKKKEGRVSPSLSEIP